MISQYNVQHGVLDEDFVDEVVSQALLDVQPVVPDSDQTHNTLRML